MAYGHLEVVRLALCKGAPRLAAYISPRGESHMNQASAVVLASCLALRSIGGTQKTQQLAWFWRCTIIVFASVFPLVAYSDDVRRSLKMFVGVVRTVDVCPNDYNRSRCAVDRTPNQHTQLLDNLVGTNEFYEYPLTSSQAVSELALPEWMINSLENVIEVGSEGSMTHSAVLIFDLAHAFQSITFTISSPDEEHVIEDEVTSIRRWYHHCQAGCIAPTNHVKWKVVADDISVEFKFVGQAATTED